MPDITVTDLARLTELQDEHRIPVFDEDGNWEGYVDEEGLIDSLRHNQLRLRVRDLEDINTTDYYAGLLRVMNSTNLFEAFTALISSGASVVPAHGNISAFTLGLDATDPLPPGLMIPAYSIVKNNTLLTENNDYSRQYF